jgi:hypothetical protein
VICGWPTASGPCRRPARPEGCGFHPAPLEPGDAVRLTCTCDRPFIDRDDDGEPICFHCGKPLAKTGVR